MHETSEWTHNNNKNEMLPETELTERWNLTFHYELPMLILFALFLISIPVYCLIRYIMAYWNSKRVGCVTRSPMIPLSRNGLTEFKGTNSMENLIPEAKIFCSGDKDGSSKSAIKKLNSIMKMVFNLEGVERNIVPSDARKISIKMDNFKHGVTYYEFEPFDGISRKSHYAFQMYGDERVQVTYYVENNVRYVAGFTIHIEGPWLWGVSFREDVFKKILNSPKYPGRKFDEVEPEPEPFWVCDPRVNGIYETLQPDEIPMVIISEVENETNSIQLEETSPEINIITASGDIPTENWSVRYCQKLKRSVMSNMQTGVVIHQEWNHNLGEMKHKECTTCSEQLENDEPPPYSSLVFL